MPEVDDTELGRSALDEQRCRRARRQLREVMGDERLRAIRYGTLSCAAPELLNNCSFVELQRLAVLDDGVSLSGLQRVKTLGHGAFSTVELVTVGRKEYAVKRLIGEPASSLGPRSSETVPAFDCHSMLCEGALLKSLRHPNVLGCHGAFLTEPERHSGPHTYALLLEFAPGGNLAERIDAADYDTLQSLRWLQGIAQALSYIHRLEGGLAVAHRDIKPTNVLIGASGEAILADFGLFRLLASEAQAQGVASEWHALGPHFTPHALIESFSSSDATLETSGQPSERAARKSVSWAPDYRFTVRTGTICYMVLI
ncbi:kinase-like domain-containing protein [Pavlovales sp. CCMP2436]|nr:kinase-like domain-containing protein [Pavlovales sp. CCMP2436]